MKKGSLSVGCMLSTLLCFMTVMVMQSGTANARTGKVHLTDKIQKVPARSALYDKDIKPLALEQCAQCHVAVFTKLKAEGKRHQKECTFCHEVYHTYAPGKVEYSEAIPKCADCHGHPHGEKPLVTTCSNCHSNAHTPVNLPNITGDMCFNCHAGPPQMLQDYPSKHTDLDCTECHTSHGYIPNCTDCHSDDGGLPFHMAGEQQNQTCLSCHSNPHSPLRIVYAEDTPKENCSNCHINPSHERVYNTLKSANSMHFTDNTCAGCHTEHGKIPECADCHDSEGHREGLVTSDCLRCHNNPHDPLNISFQQSEPKKVCGGCHVEVYNDLIQSQTRHTNQTCAFCHPRHGQIPTCQKCHGVPHGQKMIEQFGNSCQTCHDIAHKIEGRMKDDRPGSLTAEGRKGFLTTIKK